MMAGSESTSTVGLEVIPSDFCMGYFKECNFSEKCLSKGTVYFREGYIHKLIITKNDSGSEVVIGGRCYRSMRKNEKPHLVNITLCLTKKFIKDSHCSCVAGSGGRCSHIVGLIKTIQQLKLLGITEVPAEQACTSIPQTWHIPRGNKIRPVSVNQVVVVKPKENHQKSPIIPQVVKSDRLLNLTEQHKQILKCVEGAPISNLNLESTPAVSCNPVPVLLGSVFSYQSHKNDISFNMENVMSCGNTVFPQPSKVRLPPWYQNLVEKSKVVNPEFIEKDTRSQSASSLWNRLRKERLTASQMYKVVNRKKGPTEAMLKDLFKTKSFSSVPTDYGLSKENVAREKYVSLRSVKNIHVHDCGLVINNEFPYLAATPDGKVCDDGESGILEIKCPFLARQMSIAEACNSVKNFVLCCENSVVKVNQEHNYYVQIQGQLLVTGAPWCDLVVYTTKDMFIDRIYPNVSFMTKLLLHLSFFYKYHALPYLSKQ